MLLAIDVGKSDIHLAAYRGETLVDQWRVSARYGHTGEAHAAVHRASTLSLSPGAYQMVVTTPAP